MPNIPERQTDVLSVISHLDISPTLYENAVAKYRAITSFLTDCGIEAEMYPQGSFAFGTVVRPSAKNSNANYDLDFVCQVKGSRSDCTPSELRRRIHEALKSNNTYGGNLVVCEECFTVEYADISGVGFSIDIVPATDESFENKKRLISKSTYPGLIKTAIAIPKHSGDHNYKWLTNNPKGFRAWFDHINEPFLNASRKFYRQRLFEQNKNLYASIEAVPSALERSALQRVIQILKYHRDVYYSKLEDGDEIKPISAIINVSVAEIAKSIPSTCTVFELLEYVLHELEIYAQHQCLSEKSFAQSYGNRSVFSKPEGKWFISNPANPEDNLADKWNSNPAIPLTFFRWVNAAKADLLTALLQEDDHSFRVALENGFGKMAVSSVLGKKYCDPIMPKPITPQTAAKPYHKL